MENHGESAADIITGGVVARTVEPTAGEAHEHHDHGKCLNCGAVLGGAYCSNCGQAAHLHRSLMSLAHDILHGVFHFEGKVWRTLPELFFRPGRLTRRYIDGERAKFVSPMALYLFAVFLMFAMFSFGGSNFLSVPESADVLGVGQQWKQNIVTEIERLTEKIEAQQERLADPELTDEQRARQQAKLEELVATREAMQVMVSGDVNKFKQFIESQEQRGRAQAASEDAVRPEGDATPRGGAGEATVKKDRDNRLGAAIEHASDNPALLAYKLKTAGYKYSWALVPLSVPFMWLLFFWRRDIHLYDHAIFVTYSISFMMLFLVILSLADSLGVSGTLWGLALMIAPPLHLYKQLRVAYGLSRFGTWVRLFALMIIICVVLTLFSVLLLALGMTS
jgi:hypothetical protein